MLSVFIAFSTRTKEQRIIQKNVYVLLLSFLLTFAACSFYDKNDIDAELQGSHLIRLRENLPVGAEVLNLRAYPRNKVILRTSESAADRRYFKIKEYNSTNIQVLLDKSIDDLVDRDVPQNVLKFKIECASRQGRTEETSYLTVTAYIEDVNDHAPKFLHLPYRVYVDEATPVGTTVYQQIAAVDRDKPNTPNSDVQFTMPLQDHDPGGMYFTLESPHKPHVILRRQLDFDEGTRMFELPIVASVSCH